MSEFSRLFVELSGANFVSRTLIVPQSSCYIFIGVQSVLRCFHSSRQQVSAALTHKVRWHPNIISLAELPGRFLEHVIALGTRSRDGAEIYSLVIGVLTLVTNCLIV